MRIYGIYMYIYMFASLLIHMRIYGIYIDIYMFGSLLIRVYIYIYATVAFLHACL